jgi:hypothetical protein
LKKKKELEAALANKREKLIKLRALAKKQREISKQKELKVKEKYEKIIKETKKDITQELKETYEAEQ